MLAALKETVLALPYPALLPAYYAQQAFATQRVSARTRAEWGLRHLCEYEFKPKSDTLFVLGSGYSINHITEAGWAKIEQHDSIGLNFWPIHPFVPDWYFFELIEEHGRGDFSRHLARKFVQMTEQNTRYGTVPKFVTDIAPSRESFFKQLPPHWSQNLFAGVTIGGFARSTSEFEQMLSALIDVGMFEHQRRLDTVFKYRGSMSMMVAIGHQLGYRRIVLCGLDIDDPRYFFHTDAYPDFNQFLVPQKGTHHATGGDLPMMVGIETVLSSMDKLLLKPNGVELFVENRCSRLHPMLPELRAHEA